MSSQFSVASCQLSGPVRYTETFEVRVIRGITGVSMGAERSFAIFFLPALIFYFVHSRVPCAELRSTMDGWLRGTDGAGISTSVRIWD